MEAAANLDPTAKYDVSHPDLRAAQRRRPLTFHVQRVDHPGRPYKMSSVYAPTTHRCGSALSIIRYTSMIRYRIDSEGIGNQRRAQPHPQLLLLPRVIITVLVYIAEISPQNMRGALGSVNQLSVTLGTMFAYLVGLFVPWRLLAVIGTLPCIVLIPDLFFIPESLRWLAKMNMMDDCETSLQVLRGFDADITAELYDIKWVQGRAGEDRVYIVVSKEQGWVFVAIYDGFNDSDAPDYLVPHPYALCTVRSVACSGISASKRSSTTLINIVMEHKLVYIRSIRIFGEISNCLFLGCTFHSVTAVSLDFLSK
ncbi:Sugar transporter ERD6-like 6 [Zea mays]|uniref:Sugar transporter ERD6-like 6 n=1 Tax=Zea mays TaxID=4577 RepID=A0A317YFC1_MAIZE|nr:Sugar transporter ERD6-like 6 [Zea mays]